MPFLRRLPHVTSTLALVAVWLVAGCTPYPAAVAPKPPVDIGHKAYVYSKWGPDDTVRLRIAVRTFKPRNGRGPTVSLVGAIHIGETAYYQALQRYFDASSVVLFEGVGRPEGDHGHYRKPSQEQGATGYRKLAHTLNLVCQDEVIDYHRPNFRHADMDWEQLMARLNTEINHGQTKAKVGDDEAAPTSAEVAAPPDPAQDASRNAAEAKKQIEFIGSVVSGQNPLLGVSLFLLERSPAARGTVRLNLVAQTAAAANSGSLSANSRGMISPRLEKLILTERNEAAMRVLGKILRAPRAAGSPKSISVFYGAAHLPGMEKILRERFGYVPVESLWLTALTVHPEAEEVPEEMLRDLRPANQD